MSDILEHALNAVYEMMDGSEMAVDYSDRHGIGSLAILTVTNNEKAELVAGHLAERVRGKVVVEIGGGIGLLAFHLAEYAERVFVIEANPCWPSVYVAFLHLKKPKNVTFIFSAADEMDGHLFADVAIFCTHSDADGMRKAGLMLAPEVIDVYGEVIESTPQLLASLEAIRGDRNSGRKEASRG